MSTTTQRLLHYWIPEFAANCLNRYSVGDDGKTAERLRTCRGWHRPAIAFGETVLVKKLQVTVAKKDLESRFMGGHFFGHMSRSATALVMTAQGILRGTGLSRLTSAGRPQGTELTDRTPPQALPAPLTSPVPPRAAPAGRAFYITRADVERHNATQGCTACPQILCRETLRQTAPHTKERGEKLEEALLAEGGPRFMAYRERQKLSEAIEATGAVQASEQAATQAAGAALAAGTGAGTSETAGVVQAPTTTTAKLQYTNLAGASSEAASAAQEGHRTRRQSANDRGRHSGLRRSRSSRQLRRSSGGAAGSSGGAATTASSTGGAQEGQGA
eukprot:1296429-Amphidinium_carterae.2